MLFCEILRNESSQKKIPKYLIPYVPQAPGRLRRRGWGTCPPPRSRGGRRTRPPRTGTRGSLE